MQGVSVESKVNAVWKQETPKISEMTIICGYLRCWHLSPLEIKSHFLGEITCMIETEGV